MALYPSVMAYRTLTDIQWMMASALWRDYYTCDMSRDFESLREKKKNLTTDCNGTLDSSGFDMYNNRSTALNNSTR